MPQKPTVTVLMTVYNGEKYLRETVDSILNQTFDNFEFLIINDVSTDSTLDIIGEYQDSRINVYTNEKNLGQTKSLNVGLKKAQGQYVARIDADDLVLNNWIEALYDSISKDPNIAVVSARAIGIDENGHAFKVLNTPLLKQEMVLKSITSSPINHVGCMMNKDIILKEGCYDESYVLAADYHLWSRLIAKKHQIITINQVLIAVRFHQHNISVTKADERGALELVKIIGENVQRLTNSTFSHNQIELLYDIHYRIDKLNVEGVLESAVLLNELYRKVGQHNHLDEKGSLDFYHQKVRILYVKKIFEYAESKEMSNIRKLIHQYCQKFGRMNIFAIMWLLSLLGSAVFTIVPWTYNAWNKIKSKRILRNHPVFS